MRHTGYVSSFFGNRYMNCFPYKETHFFDFIQFPSCIAQLCNLVAHPVGVLYQERWFPRNLADSGNDEFLAV